MAKLVAPAISSAMVLALPLAMLEAILIEGWDAFRFWDLSSGRQLFATTFPCWFVTLLVARLLVERKRWKKVYSIRLFVAVTWLLLVVSFISAAIATKKKLGYFLSHEHFRFGFDNLLRLSLHFFQTAPTLVVVGIVFTITGSFTLLFLLKQVEIRWSFGSHLARMSIAFLLFGLAHWLIGIFEGTWPKSAWALLLPPLTSERASTPSKAFSHWVPRSSEQLTAKPPKEKFPVVLILVESVRADLLTRHPHVIPFLRELGQSGVVFDKAYAPATHSDYSDLSVWYSRYPLLSGTRMVWRADDPRRGLSTLVHSSA